jgi:hypothetical protein
MRDFAESGARAPDTPQTPVTADDTNTKTRSAVCQRGASGAAPRAAVVSDSADSNLGRFLAFPNDMTETIIVHAPTLAAGWSLLYLLFGGGIGGAILIFVGLKAIGK